jgi:UPF0755 protein
MTNRSAVASLVVGVVLAVIIGGAGWVIASSPSSVSRFGARLPEASGETVYIKVEAGDTAASIGRRLAQAGVIDSAGSFELIAKITNSERRLAAGEYEFYTGTSVVDALTRIRDGLTSARVVAVPEGMRLEEIAALLERRGVVKSDEFLAAANSIATVGSALDVDLLSSRPASATLEGYAYPATYSFSRNIGAPEVVLTMLKALGERLPPPLREEARLQGLSVHQVLTLASIVEREVVDPAERALIASVYRNRLKIDMPLQADPTVQFAITVRPGNIVQFGYWKRALDGQDLQFDSSYNTYLRRGLPPGPIANPGIESILAVIRPADTTYLYFVAKNDGSHAFSATYEEHQQNVARYQP